MKKRGIKKVRKSKSKKVQLEKKEIVIKKEEVKIFSDKILNLKREIGKVVIDQDEVVDGLVRALICNGHVIVEGVPGIAKTLLIKALGAVSCCDVKRVQFTVDLLPTDIVGLTIYKKNKGFEVIRGPVFTNFLIADEINRSPPKTQSALLEAMQENQVTIGRNTCVLPKPFFVMATQNPIELEGVYSLPEAQLDRFLFKLLINYPKKDKEKIIMKQNIDLKPFENFALKKVISVNDVIKMQALVKKIHLSETIEDYIVNIVDATRDKNGKYAKYIQWGGSPRATIGLYISSKAEALMNGRTFVKPEDVKKVVLDVLRHRMILTYEAETKEISVDWLIENILNEIPMP